MPDPTLQRVDGSALRFLLAGDIDTPRSMVLLLHGSGSDCHNLFPVAEAFSVRLPGTLLVVPNAPQSQRDSLTQAEIDATEGARPGIEWEKSRTWVGASDARATDRASAIRALHDVVNPPVRALSRLTDLLLARYGLTDDALGIYGFSQGGLIALNLGIARTKPCAAVVSHSGHFLGTLEPLSRPRTLLVVGSQELEPTRALSRIHPITRDELRALEVPVEEFICEGLAHDINKVVVERVCAFLAAALDRVTASGDNAAGESPNG